MSTLTAPVTLQVPDLPRPLTVQVHGPDDQHVSRQLREQGIWEPFETQLLMQHVQPGAMFLDVGANIGYFSVIVAACLGDDGQVFAVEPEPANAALLRENVLRNGLHERITVAELALSDVEQPAQLHISENNFGDHQLFAQEAGRTAISVSCVRGADWLRGQTERLDLVKIDVQGAECAVVAGLMPLLQASLPELRMLVELSPRSLRLSGHSGRELIVLLASLGLQFFIVDHLQEQLVNTDAEALAVWCDNIDTVPNDAGFMNIYLSPEL